MFIVVNLLKVLHLILCVVVVVGVLFMNQKSEGLSGIMGGMSQSMRGVKGMDEGMRRFITWMGGALIISSILLGMLGE
jgi:protein translocase SecG subunit